ncbi:MAG: flagellar basal body P-ring formation chaperone FlgA [Deltaproteobacteria bacterium]
MKRNKPKMRSLQAIVLTTLLVVSLPYGSAKAWADNQTYVNVTDQAWVSGEKVYLKDIASISGPPRVRERLGMVCLAYAPSPGRHKTLHGSWIEGKVRSKRWLPANVRLKIPELIHIGRTSQTISEENFLQQYTGYVAEQLKVSESDFRISRFRVVGNGPVPEGKLRVELADQAGGRGMGHVSLSAIVRVEGKIERRVVLTGWVDRFDKVVCTLRPLDRHTILSAEDLALERRNISKLPANVLKTVEDVVGKRLKHRLKAGSVLLANTVERPPLVKKGDRVTIMAESPNLTVTAVGIAQSKGSAGDQIRVTNCMGKKEIIARVVDGSTVKVDF